tara:strand:+ start:385 stop:684 length:300 start_codon:yes stop_codon:yes gene_type:complete
MELPHVSGESRPAPIVPRLLTAAQTATYLGYRSIAILRALPIYPIRLSSCETGGAPRWDKVAVDAWLDTKSDLKPTPSNGRDDADVEVELNAWRAGRAH